MSLDINTFDAKCIYCNTMVKTKSDQSFNPKFVCSKDCRTKLTEQQKQENINKKYGVKVIPKYSSDYIPYILLKVLPQHWFQNYVRCDKCYRRFYSDDVPQFCNKCINDTIPIDTNCSVCDKIYSATPNKIKLKHNMCTDCFSITGTDFVCDICRCIFVDTHKTYNDLDGSICMMCRSSNKIKHKYIHSYQNNDTIKKMLDINEKNIKIYYNIIDESHDGNCYETELIEKNIFTEEKIFPFMNEFNSEFNLMKSEKFNYYYTPTQTANCASGCVNKIYKIIKYEIVN